MILGVLMVLIVNGLVKSKPLGQRMLEYLWDLSEVTFFKHSAIKFPNTDHFHNVDFSSNNRSDSKGNKDMIIRVIFRVHTLVMYITRLSSSFVDWTSIDFLSLQSCSFFECNVHYFRGEGTRSL